jgi:hypothetical protein
VQDFGKFFWHVSHRVQITFILTDDVRVLYLSYNVKKSKKQIPNCRKSLEINVVLIMYKVVHAYTVTVAYRKSNSWWSVAVYSKTIFSQRNLTAQIEQVQDK